MGMVLINNKCNVKSISLIKAAVYDPPLFSIPFKTYLLSIVVKYET